MPSRDKKSRKKKKRSKKKKSISTSKREKKNYEILDEQTPKGKESYGEEPWFCACDCKRCLNGRCGVGWLVCLGLTLAGGFVTLMWFGGILGTTFETSGSDTLYYEICDGCTHEPTGSPTLEPTGVPSVEPTPAPTNEPTVEPTIAPSVEPTLVPTIGPSVEPTLVPTDAPTVEPTAAPTGDPSTAPSYYPTGTPSEEPTGDPSVHPTFAPSGVPSVEPTSVPTNDPTLNPTPSPTKTNAPTADPTTNPTANPSASPSNAPTKTGEPTADPTMIPTADPSSSPTYSPTRTDEPTRNPTSSPTEAPTNEPTSMPTINPTVSPTDGPTRTDEPTTDPTSSPTWAPTNDPTSRPTKDPTLSPTNPPTTDPTLKPTVDPTLSPTNLPTIDPTLSPTSVPTATNEPTADPTSDPTSNPTVNPTLDPTSNPTVNPTLDPTSDTTSDPTLDPTSDPTASRRLYDLSEWIETPNILLIVTENSWADFSAYETPNMDEFLEESYNFSDIHSQFSRGSLVTGQRTPRLGMGMILKACDEGHLPFDIPTWAEYLKLKGYNNYYYGKWNLGADSWHATPLGRGWDSFYGCLNRPDGLEHGDGGSWVKLQVSCPSNVKPTKTFKAQSYPQCLMKCYGSQVAAFESSTCRCYSHAVCTEPSKHSFVYTRLSQKDVIIDWWKGSKPADPGVGKTGNDLIIQEVLPHLQTLKAEVKWTMTVSFASPGNGYAPFNDIPESCKKYFDNEKRDLNFQRGVACQWMWDSDKKVGIIIDEIKKTDLWSETIVLLTNFNSNDDRTIFSIGGGALPAQLVSSTNEDLHSVVDITPTILAIAGFSDGDLKSANLDGVNVVDINKATAKVHDNIDEAVKETKSKENNQTDPSNCGSKQSFTSLLGLRYNAPWLEDDIALVRK